MLMYKNHYYVLPIKKIQCGVGTFIYLTEFSILDMSNCVRIFRNDMTHVNQNIMKQLFREIKCVSHTRDLGLNLKPRFKYSLTWSFRTYTDSNFTGDSDSIKNISVWGIFINYCLFSWGSKKQIIVELSFREAKYIAG